MGTTDYTDFADYTEVVTRSALTQRVSGGRVTHEQKILFIRVIRVIRGNFHRRFQG